MAAPGRSGRGPRRDPGGSQRDRPTPASPVPPYRAPGSRGVSGAPATAVKGKETQAGGTQIGTGRSAGGPRSPRRRQARRPTARAAWRAGDAATARDRESGNGRPAAGGLWAGAAQSPKWVRIFSMTGACWREPCLHYGSGGPVPQWSEPSDSPPAGNGR